MDNPIIEEYRALFKLDLPQGQKKFYEQLLKDAKPVKCVSVNEVFTQGEIRMIKAIVDPKPKQCYRNALLLANLFPDRCKYVEGFGWSYFAIEHGFNRVGDKYVDITFEMVLGYDVTELPYVSLIEEQAEKVIEDVKRNNMMTGEYYRRKYIESLSK